MGDSPLALEAGSWGSYLALAYLLISSGITALAPRPPRRRGRILATNFSLMVCFVALLVLGEGPPEAGGGWIRFFQLWAPIIFFWWAYKWAGNTLHLFYPADFSWDSVLIRFERKYLGLPSLGWAKGGSRGLTELLHFFYATYYLYTPGLGIYLYARGEFGRFEAMALAVLLGSAICYIFSPFLPVWGPRWALVEAGLLESSEQQLRGYGLTRAINYVMYGGIAHKGGAMPSSHTSTAVVFFFWSAHLWGFWGGVATGVVVVGMGIGAIYGRYHYVSDIGVGMLLGAFTLWATGFFG